MPRQLEVLQENERQVLLPVVYIEEASPNLPKVFRDPPVGGRLQEFWQNWERRGVELSVVLMLKEGYRLVLSEKPPLRKEHLNIRLPANPQKRVALLSIVRELQEQRVIEVVEQVHSPGYYNHFFYHPKVNSREVASHLGPQAVQQLHVEGEVQDGDSGVHQSKSQYRRLGHFPGFHLSLPSYTHSQSFKKISPIRYRRCNIPIQGLTYGPDIFSENVHEGDQVCPGAGSNRRYPFAPVPGRLVGEGTLKRTSGERHRVCDESSCRARIQDQLGEIRDFTLPRDHVSSVQISVRQGNCFPNRTEMGKDPGSSETVSHAQKVDSEMLAVSNRTTSFDGEAGPSGDVSFETNSNRTVEFLVPDIPVSRGTNRSESGSIERVDLVAEQRESDDRSTDSETRDAVPSLYRCLDVRLGRAFGEHGGTGDLGRARERSPCQCSGDARCAICSVPLQRLDSRKVNLTSDRQFHGDVLHQETGRNQVKELVEGYTDVVRLSKSIQDRPSVSTYSGAIECPGRQFIKKKK